MNLRLSVIAALLFGLAILLLESGDGSAGQEIRAGDRVEVAIVAGGATDDAEVMTVSNQGTVNVPLVGDIRVAGQTAEELGNRLSVALAREYYVNPRVEVRVVPCSTP
jgi:polysaccharide export outer membrane protein